VTAGNIALRATFDAVEGPQGGHPLSGTTHADAVVAMSPHIPLPGRFAPGSGTVSPQRSDAIASTPARPVAPALASPQSMLPPGALPLRPRILPPAAPAAAVAVPPSLSHMAGRVGRAMEPLVDRAAAMTEATLAGESGEEDGFSAGEGAASSAPPQAQVSNTFNVTVNLDASRPDAAAEQESLQDALGAILLDAARRQGLDL
jgi:hypothetical protein